jgi:hypothetical protein
MVWVLVGDLWCSIQIKISSLCILESSCSHRNDNFSGVWCTVLPCPGVCPWSGVLSTAWVTSTCSAELDNSLVKLSWIVAKLAWILAKLDWTVCVNSYNSFQSSSRHLPLLHRYI